MLPTLVIFPTLVFLLLISPRHTLLSPFAKLLPTLPLSPSLSLHPAKYTDLPKVSPLLIESFYDNPSALLIPYHNLSELDRLQTTFPYSPLARHAMYVAKHEIDGIVGFIDVSYRYAMDDVLLDDVGRKEKTPYMTHSAFAPVPTGPYISDLCVSPHHRRQGIGSALISICESTAWQWGTDVVYLRVKTDNEGGCRVYGEAGWEWVRELADGTAVLQKDYEQVSTSKR